MGFNPRPLSRADDLAISCQLDVVTVSIRVRSRERTMRKDVDHIFVVQFQSASALASGRFLGGINHRQIFRFNPRPLSRADDSAKTLTGAAT